jgi:hypothetical protein
LGFELGDVTSDGLPLWSCWFITCGPSVECCGAVMAGFAIASPDAAIAPAKPMGFVGGLRLQGRDVVFFFGCPGPTCELTDLTSVSRRLGELPE